MAEIEASGTPVNCLIAQARAESLVEALEVLKAIPADAVERLDLMIVQSRKSGLPRSVASNEKPRQCQTGVPSFPAQKIATSVAIPSHLLIFCYSKNTVCLQGPETLGCIN